MVMKYDKELIKTDGRRLLRGGPRDMQRRQIESIIPIQTPIDVDIFKEQIEELKQELKEAQKANANNKPKGYFSPEEVDSEIRKAVESAVAETVLSFKKKAGVNNTEIESILKTYKQQIFELQKTNDDLSTLHKNIINQNTELRNQNNEFKEQIEKLKNELNEINELKNEIAILKQTISGKDELIMVLKSRITGTEEITDPDRPQMEQVYVDPLEKDSGKDLESHIKIEELERDDDDGVDDKVDKLRGLLGKLPKK